MLLKSILNSLIQNELRNLAIGKPEWADSTFSYVSLIECLNMGYIELHKRFSIKKERVILRIDPSLNEYVLSLAHADSNTISMLPKYIQDTALRPFSDNVVKVDQIYDQDHNLIAASTTYPNSDIYLIDDLTVYVTDPSLYTSLLLQCRSLPQLIVLATEMELDTYDVPLSSIYLEALLCYAAGRVYINRGAENTTNNESAIFFARYEQACAKIDLLGLSPKEEFNNVRLTSRGFV